MNLIDLFSDFPGLLSGEGLDQEAANICFDSRRVQPGDVFVAIRGEKGDGHSFVVNAIERGAIAVVVERGTEIDLDAIGRHSTLLVSVENTRTALSRLASRFFHDPAKKLFCVGVTGTNGKTSITLMIEALLNSAGRATGVIGTIDHHLRDRVWRTDRTTPDPVSFQQRLAEFVDLGASALAIEVTSHALHQSRVDEVPFHVGVFTNLTRDHLDYHGDMENYYLAKKKLFTGLLQRSTAQRLKPVPTAVISLDDSYGSRLAKETRACGVNVLTYGNSAKADLRITVHEQGFDGTKFTVTTAKEAAEFHLRMPGLHNVHNATAAIGAALSSGATTLAACVQPLDRFSGVAGRLQVVPNAKGIHVFVDYAHTDDAIDTVLRSLRQIRETSRLSARIITVFGCGGDRDRGKRPLMMKAARAGSDLVVLTSDNPRTEDPDAILRDALAGCSPADLGKTVFPEVDRRRAIRKAIEFARPGDVILIAGKGHEDYQIIGTVKNPFSDVQVVKEIFG